MPYELHTDTGVSGRYFGTRIMFNVESEGLKVCYEEAAQVRNTKDYHSLIFRISYYCGTDKVSDFEFQSSTKLKLLFRDSS
jgi:hypothetical protein